jgi:hypothetical protein
MEKKYELTKNVLYGNILDLVRVFEKYSISKSQSVQNEKGIIFLSGKYNIEFNIKELNGISLLNYETKLSFGKPKDNELQIISEELIMNLDKITNKEILITPEIANIDPFKKAEGASLLSIIQLIIAIVAILYGLKYFLS